MSNKLDEIAKGMAQSVSRRQALRRFGVGLVAIGLASFGFANKSQTMRHWSDKDCLGPCPTGTKCRGFNGHCTCG